ncbi:MAG: TetR/AcrR family transcriptional regulator [Candidatus Izemoplasma sp.]|nr:TetR/AcrR family transcriptional regulator [Candidatus Izemoplasma sp.]
MKTQRKQRNKQYFIDAAKTIIEQEGIESVSARKVADIAGFSYATIYNYFKDIDSLLTYTAVDYLQSCHDDIIKTVNLKQDNLAVLIDYAKAYFNYMNTHPNLFKLIFINRLGDVPKEVAKDLVPKPAIFMRELLARCDQSLFQTNLDDTFELLSSSMHGKLLFIIHKRTHLNSMYYLNQIESEIRLLTGGKL